jgi:hypothetical protein
MPTPAFVGGAVPDELLRLTGSTNTPAETITATGNGAGIYVGENRALLARLLIAGVVSGTSPTLDIKFQDSADGVTYADRGIAFPQQTASMATATGALANFPEVVVNTRPGKPYLRVVKTVGGTSPSFAGVSVNIQPLWGGVV